MIIKPTTIRLALWQFFPVFAGLETVRLIGNATWHRPVFLFEVLVTAIGMFVASLIISVVFSKVYEIVILDGKVSGPGGTFLVSDLEASSLDKQSFYEKISGSHRLHSKTGKKIWVVDFIYEKSQVKGIYDTLKRLHSETNDR